MSSGQNDHFHDGGSGYETRDVDVRKVFFFILLGIAALVLILFALNAYFSYVAEEEIYEMVLRPESKDLVELRQNEDRILNSYGVVDSVNGVYRIPIDSAMKEILREQGITAHRE
jgi:hypothetical protein